MTRLPEDASTGAVTLPAAKQSGRGSGDVTDVADHRSATAGPMPKTSQFPFGVACPIEAVLTATLGYPAGQARPTR